MSDKIDIVNIKKEQNVFVTLQDHLDSIKIMVGEYICSKEANDSNDIYIANCIAEMAVEAFYGTKL